MKAAINRETERQADTAALQSDLNVVKGGASYYAKSTYLEKFLNKNFIDRLYQNHDSDSKRAKRFCDELDRRGRL